MLYSARDTGHNNAVALKAYLEQHLKETTLKMEHPMAPTIIIPSALLLGAKHDGPIWSLSSEQLNINLLRFSTSEGIPPHINNEVDVLIVIVEGEGALMLGDEERPIRSGEAVFIPHGVRRAIRCTSGTLAYLSCHRRRGGLMPS